LKKCIEITRVPALAEAAQQELSKLEP